MNKVEQSSIVSEEEENSSEEIQRLPGNLYKIEESAQENMSYQGDTPKGPNRISKFAAKIYMEGSDF
jgi:hypothetical protein